MRSRSRLVELVLVLALIIGGAWLRWLHLDTPSLWWDELVQIRTVEHGTAAEVWRAARDGVVPGTGNAGAMPVDYLVLHAWLRVAPPPSPATMERHYRVPAFVLSVAALPLMWALGRAVGGPVAGAVALALLATAIPPSSMRRKRASTRSPWWRRS